jgi:hypothetical protein
VTSSGQASRRGGARSLPPIDPIRFYPFLLLSFLPTTSAAQFPSWLQVGAHAVALYTGVDPVAGGRSLGEVRVVQPVLMAHLAFSERIRLLATFNFEGLTIPGGELTPGDWGEGFIDRRHPHTYVHELMLSADDVLGSVDGDARVSLSVGKGFAPFGTDDPMSRPVLRYPVNHHLSQILERAVAIVGGRMGPIMLEGGLFNGDEPERPGQWPRVARFGDSWSGRLSAQPFPALELQGSYAKVHSPEHRPGSGTDQHKESLSARWDGEEERVPLYGLLEWSRTSEADGFFVFHSFLAEGAWTRGRSRLHYRFERTDRPEEERTLSPFRSIRPHLENSILGTTRWTIHTLGYTFRMSDAASTLDALPFLELSRGRVTDVGGGLFDVLDFYGKSTFWSASFGVRLSFGMPMHRMGRYGVAEPTDRMSHNAHDRHEH